MNEQTPRSQNAPLLENVNPYDEISAQIVSQSTPVMGQPILNPTNVYVPGGYPPPPSNFQPQQGYMPPGQPYGPNQSFNSQNQMNRNNQGYNNNPNQGYNNNPNQGYNNNPNQGYNNNPNQIIINTNQQRSNQGYGPNQQQRPNQVYIPALPPGPAQLRIIPIRGDRRVIIETHISENQCPYCGYMGPSEYRHTPGCTTYSWCICLLWFTGFCCWIPFVVDGCQDVLIACPRCRRIQARLEAQCCG